MEWSDSGDGEAAGVCTAPSTEASDALALCDRVDKDDDDEDDDDVGTGCTVERAEAELSGDNGGVGAAAAAPQPSSPRRRSMVAASPQTLTPGRTYPYGAALTARLFLLGPGPGALLLWPTNSWSIAGDLREGNNLYSIWHWDVTATLSNHGARTKQQHTLAKRETRKHWARTTTTTTTLVADSRLVARRDTRHAGG